MDENMIPDALDIVGSEARYLSIIEGETELICRYLPDGRLSFVNEAYARYYEKERRDITERKHIENALKESEERYRKLFENSRDGFVVVDKAGRFLDANSAYCEMVGYTVDELRRMENFFEITPKRWHDWEREEIWFKRLFKAGSSGVYVKEYIRKNGEVFPVELNAFTIFGEDGSPFNLWGIARDITERKELEAEREKLIIELKNALAKVKQLSGMLPICSYCKKIRDDNGYWEQLESYITNHSEALFSHCMCADCEKKAYAELDALRELNKRQKDGI